MAANTVGSNNQAQAANGPSTGGIVGAVIFWVVAIALSFFTSAVEDQPTGVWVLRGALMLAGVAYTIFLIIREAGQRRAGHSDSDSSAFDLWTIAHTTAGLVMGAWGVPFPLVVIFTIAWEFFEKYVPGFGESEIFSNRIVDIAVAWVGWIVVAGLVALTTQTDMPWLLPLTTSLIR
ncbi:MAG: hypothetical protein GC204_11840 [Chloroflexi bacterium]|nr:hypothetical protein [Chloroflexota bacterium]